MSYSRTLVGMLLIAFAFSGCDFGIKFDPTQFDQAIARMDRAILAINDAIDKLTKDSASWRMALEKLEKDLADDAQGLLVHEVHDVAASFSADVGDQFKIAADYIEAKLKANLEAIREALTKAREEVRHAKNKKDYNGLGLALTKLANVKVFLDPVVTAFIPSSIEINWHDPVQTSNHVRTPLIAVRGWGFDRPANEKPQYSIAVMDKSGKLRTLPAIAVSTTTRYMLQVNLETPEVSFEPGDLKLVFSLGSSDTPDRRELPITHKIPEKKVTRTKDEVQSHTIHYRHPQGWSPPPGGEHWKEEWACPDGWKIFAVEYKCETDPGFPNPGGACGYCQAERNGGWDADYDILDDGRKAVVYRRIGTGGFTMQYIIRYKRTVTVTE